MHSAAQTIQDLADGNLWTALSMFARQLSMNHQCLNNWALAGEPSYGTRRSALGLSIGGQHLRRWSHRLEVLGVNSHVYTAVNIKSGAKSCHFNLVSRV